jgi:hypothetical protein
MSYKTLSCFSVQDKERDKERDVQHQYGQQHSREREKSGDKFEKGDGHKDVKKKEEKLRWRKRKLLGPGIGSNIQKTEQRSVGGKYPVCYLMGRGRETVLGMVCYVTGKGGVKR